MRSPEDIYAELEADRASRESEIRLVERYISSSQENEADMLKRSLILLAYSHLEGFCKFSLLAYASFINARKLECSIVIPAIAAASLSSVFACLRDPQRKHPAFRGAKEFDATLQLAWREQEFVVSYQTIASQKVEIPDSHIDTGFNINADVLRRLLFKMGLDFSVVEPHRQSINKLLGMRNAIAHGDRIKVPKDKEIQEYINSIFEIMAFIQGAIYENMKNEAYIKAA